MNTKQGKEVLYTKGSISGYDSLGDTATFYCPKPEVWTRTLFGHKRGWDEEEEMIVSKTTGPEGSETIYDLQFNEKNLKELFNNRKNDEINFVLKEELGGEARQVKDINCFKTMELFQKPFAYLWNADYLGPQLKAESRQRPIDKGLISPIQVTGLEAQQQTKPPAGTYS